MLQVVVSQTVTLLNSDTHTRRIKLSGANVISTGHKVYLPLVMRNSAGSLFAPWPNLAQLFAPAGEEIITLDAGQSVTRTFTTVGNISVSDADNPAVTAATLLVTPPALAKTGNVSGLVRDFKTKAVISGARITTVESPTLQTTSDAQGNYIFRCRPAISRWWSLPMATLLRIAKLA